MAEGIVQGNPWEKNRDNVDVKGIHGKKCWDDHGRKLPESRDLVLLGEAQVCGQGFWEEGDVETGSGNVAGNKGTALRAWRDQSGFTRDPCEKSCSIPKSWHGLGWKEP